MRNERLRIVRPWSRTVPGLSWQRLLALSSRRASRLLSSSYSPLSLSLILLTIMAAAMMVVSDVRAAELAQVFTVNTAEDKFILYVDGERVDKCETDPGDCTLREAIFEANLHPGKDVINFAIPGAGPHTITLLDGLPPITDAIVIDGYSQPGAAVATEDQPATLQVELSGANLSPGHNGLVVEAESAEVRGLAINGFLPDATQNDLGGFGIVLGLDSSAAKITGNHLGTDVPGTTAKPNGSGIGVFSVDNTLNTIGGAAAGDRNVLSGNTFSGIRIFSGRTTLQGNFMGTNASASSQVGNQREGVLVAGATGTTIESNVVSGNGSSGVWIGGPTATGNTVKDNKIGTNKAGTAPIGNKQVGVGIYNAANNTIDANTISGNGWYGVYIANGAGVNALTGNSIGTNIGGTSSDPDGTPNSGDELGNGNDGVRIIDSGGNTIGSQQALNRNIISGNARHGVHITGAASTANVILGNHIGVDAAGSAAIPNAGDGVHIMDAPMNVVGGDAGLTYLGVCTGACNVISGNGGDGIEVSGGTATANSVLGNHIGVNQAGASAVGNGVGIRITGAPSTIIGDASSAAGNVISGNLGDGVVITGGAASGTKLSANLIGTSSVGTAIVENAGDGVLIDGAPDTQVGGLATIPGLTPGNMISGNSLNGVHIKGVAATGTLVYGNLIGVNLNGNQTANVSHGVFIDRAELASIGGKTSGQGNVIAGNGGDGVRISSDSGSNTVRANNIYRNDGLGINLVSDSKERPNGVTPNDDGDLDIGPNDLLNFPTGVTAYYDGTKTIISGVVANRDLVNTEIDVFANRTVNASGFGEGEKYLGTVKPASGADSFLFEIAGKLEFPVSGSPTPVPFPYVSATATDAAAGVTSEFSAVCGDSYGSDGNPDSDGDGLCDDWELKGIDYDGNGSVDLNLSAFGAVPGEKDLFVEADWMPGAKPDSRSIAAVQTSFANAPVDGGKGIFLHVLEDEQVPDLSPISFNKRGPNNNDDFWDIKLGSPANPCGAANSKTATTSGHFGTVAERTNLNCPAIIGAKRLVYRYTIFGKTYTSGTSSSGISELPGNDSLVTVSTWSSAGYAVGGVSGAAAVAAGKRVLESGTFMHEFGHALSLRHGGTDHINYKPNFLSIMNYTFQFRSRVSDRPLDYSRWALRTLFENSLNEPLGIDNTPAPGVSSQWPSTAFTYYNASKNQCIFGSKVKTTGPIDWNRDGDSTDVLLKLGINDYDLGPKVGDLDCQAYTGQTLTSREDWSNILYNFRATTKFALGVAPEETDLLEEMTESELIESATITDFDDDGLSNADDNCPAIANPSQADTDGDGIGDACTLVSFDVTMPAAPAGSPAIATVNLLEPAPPDGSLVELFADIGLVPNLPRWIAVPGGQSTASVAIPINPFLPDPTALTFIATYGIHEIETNLVIEGLSTADLSVEKTANPSTPAVGQVLTYEITVRNNSSDAASGVTVVDALPSSAQFVSAEADPAGTCSQAAGTVVCLLGTLGPGGVATVTVRVIPQSEGDITNSASVASLAADLDTSNNDADVTVTVGPGTAVVVNSADDVDDGACDAVHCSLREAILLSTSTPTPDTIAFDIPGPGPHTIQPLSPLPVITGVATIDGTTEPDFLVTPVVELNGSLAGPGADGLHITAGNSTVRGLAINGFAPDSDGNGGNGIVLETGGGNMVSGNFIGVDTTGSAAAGNGASGVYLLDSSDNMIGGGTTALCNVISGNIGHGILLGPGSRNNTVQGNYVGISSDGTAPVGNGTGITVASTSSNVIVENVVSGNNGAGVAILLSSNNDLRGNFIGAGPDGMTNLGNGSHGVLIDNDGACVINIGGVCYFLTLPGLGLPGDNAIGNGTAADGNIIAFNGGAGIFVNKGPFNTVQANSIFSNSGLGIDIAPLGVNPNGLDTYNSEHNSPEPDLAFSGGGATTVEGTLTGPEFPYATVGGTVFPTSALVEFFSVSTCDSSGYGEGAVFLGSTTVLPRGTVHFSATFPVEVPPGHFITATSTKRGQTSEFSACVEVMPDADGDGVFDTVEDAAPNGGDANNDGTADRLQSDVASLPNAVNGDYVVLETEDDVPLRNVRAVANPSPENAPPGVDFPAGFFEFTTVAGSATVTATLPAGVAADAVYAFGPTPNNGAEHWYQFTFDGISGAESTGASPVLRMVDDRRGDHGPGGDDRTDTLLGFATLSSSGGVTLTVNTTDDADDGTCDDTHCSLREAINASNFIAGKDLIAFNIPGDGPHTISPLSTPHPVNSSLRIGLPEITDPVVIDGYIEPGAVPATADSPAVLMIELDGSLAEGPVFGLDIAAGDTTIRGLAINRFKSGPAGRSGAQINLRVAGGNFIEGNHIGTDVAGTATHGLPLGYADTQRYGIQIDRTSNNTIGGLEPGQRNVIGGHERGIYMFGGFNAPASDNMILGNYIGTDATGAAALPNRDGISVDGSSTNNHIGLPGAGRNIISGNTGVGVALSTCGRTVEENFVQGNYIGTDVTGTQAQGNGVAGVSLSHANRNLIGGDTPGAGNLISGNNGVGIGVGGCETGSYENVIQGNLIGTDVSGVLPLGNAQSGISLSEYAAQDRNDQPTGTLVGGTSPLAGNVIAFNGGDGITVGGGPSLNYAVLGNRIVGNSIFQNALLGIDLGSDGVTPNDPLDGDAPGNATPHVVSLDITEVNGNTFISLVFEGKPNNHYQIGVQFTFSSLGFTVLTDENGLATFETGVGSNPGDFVQTSWVDADDTTGPNDFQNYPVLESAVVNGDTQINGFLDSSPSTEFELEFFVSPAVDPSGYGEGAEPIGRAGVTTGADGIAPFSIAFTEQVPLNSFITATATDPDGNTSEFSLAIQPETGPPDFGDAPDAPYPSLLANNGARHVIRQGFQLGAFIDGEPDALQSPAADGDGADDDGVVFDIALTPGGTAQVTVTASAPGFLDAWIDFDGDGSWDSAGNQVFTSEPLLPGANVLEFAVPASAVAGSEVFARFRFSSTGGLSFDGIAYDGEAEDYLVAIAAENAPPVANDDSASIAAGSAAIIDVLANDTDPEGSLDPDSVALIVGPANGTVLIDAVSGAALYTPDSSFTGDDSFEYEVCDIEGACDTATVSVEVLAVESLVSDTVPPDAVDDEAETNAGTSVVIDVLANDSDPDGVLDPSTLDIATSPANGLSVLGPSDEQVTYTPNAGFHGDDSFTYYICDDDGACDGATVHATVNPFNASPVANNDFASTSSGVPVTADVLANDTDPDDGIDPTSVVLMGPPPSGALEVDPVDGKITYTPEAGFAGVAVSGYTACDMSGECDDAVLVVEVQPTFIPPEANDDAAVTDEGTPVVINVVANDTDADGTIDPASVIVVEPPLAGSVVIGPADGEVTYSPSGDFTGEDFFSYRVSDNDGQHGFAAVSVTVRPVNDPPMANDDAAVTPENVPAQVNVLANDTDPDGDIASSSVTVSSPPANGSAVPGPGLSYITYTPNPEFSGTDQFVYQLCDLWGYCDDATVTVDVEAVHGDVPPVADAGGPYVVAEGSSLNLNGSGSIDPDGTITLYEWDLDEDGVFGETGIDAANGDETGIAPLFSAALLDGPVSVTISLRATDDDGLADVASTQLQVLNVAPTGVLSNTGPIDAGQPVEVSFSEQLDPSSDDTAEGFLYSYDFGNTGTFDIVGSDSPVAPVPPDLVAAGPAIVNVRGRIEDKDGGFNDYITTVFVNGGPVVIDCMSNITYVVLFNTAQFDPAPVDGGAGGTFFFFARLTNTSGVDLENLAETVTILSDGVLLLEADGGPGGVGATYTIPLTGDYADGVLSPGESIDVPHTMGLTTRSPFDFFVDVGCLAASQPVR